MRIGYQSPSRDSHGRKQHYNGHRYARHGQEYRQKHNSARHESFRTEYEWIEQRRRSYDNSGFERQHSEDRHNVMRFGRQPADHRPPPSPRYWCPAPTRHHEKVDMRNFSLNSPRQPHDRSPHPEEQRSNNPFNSPHPPPEMLKLLFFSKATLKH